MARLPNDAQINEVLNKAEAQIEQGGSKFPGMSYEEGLKAAIEWLRGDTDENPMPEE